MPWLAPLSGFVNALGYTYCVKCCPQEPAKVLQRVYADTYPACKDPCEGCGKTLRDVSGREPGQH